MLKILNEVIARRMEKSMSPNTTIRLSSFLMKILVEEFNRMMNSGITVELMKGKDFVKIINRDIIEFKYNHWGIEFIIQNRAYKDENTDEDVEQVLYNWAMMYGPDLDSSTGEMLLH